MIDRHRLKPVLWRNLTTLEEKPLWIVTQNENGPCPLIALVNVLVLKGEIQVKNESNDSNKTILTSELISMLANYLFSHNIKENTKIEGSENDENLEAANSDENAGSSVTGQVVSQKESNIDKVIKCLPSLSTGLDVNIQFDSLHGIEQDSTADIIFKTFGVDFVHGWLVDPLEQGEIFEILTKDCKNSYEGAASFVFYGDSLSNGTLVDAKSKTPNQQDGPSSTLDENVNLNESKIETINKALLVSEFLDNTATQITPYGLQMIGEVLPDNYVCIFFRNNHFVTLFKRYKGELFTLCTDESLSTDSRIVWETLNDINQVTSIFVDSFFQPISLVETKGGAQANNNAVMASPNQKGIGKNGELGLSIDKQTTSADYIRNDSEDLRGWFDNTQTTSAGSKTSQLDMDYEYALSLQQKENEIGIAPNKRRVGGKPPQTHRAQQDILLPPGMKQGSSALYGIPMAPGNTLGERGKTNKLKKTDSQERFQLQLENQFHPSNYNNYVNESYSEDELQEEYRNKQNRANFDKKKSPGKKSEGSGCIIS
ncbi:hypothetical protein BB558_003106 [Smittium angustum]|uniref:MINDY deubiquitinase domain-containing protein n=1 Tax=Smittium angustum TaxID=133377 RepID=A0A2U1J742_SMIAN|nr:hypothetical protein BB558_003106 [Smittium angustum]